MKKNMEKMPLYKKITQKITILHAENVEKCLSVEEENMENCAISIWRIGMENW